MNTLSVFHNTFTPLGAEPLSDIIHKIRAGFFRHLVSQYRGHRAVGDRLQARLTRRQLLAFTPCGQFQALYANDGLLSYSQLVLLETESIHPNLLDFYRQLLLQDPYTHACFRSAAGDTLRFLVRTDVSPDQHPAVFSELRHYFGHLLHLRLLGTGEDLTTLCHYSFDPRAYFNPDSEVFCPADCCPTRPVPPAQIRPLFDFASTPAILDVSVA
jgi:hypothetical protein